MHHPHNLPFNNSVTHSLTRLSRQLAIVPGVIFQSEVASPAGVSVQYIRHNNRLFTNSITHSLHSLVSTAGHCACCNLSERSCLARRCQCKALDTLVLSAAAGRAVVEVAARQRCFVVQCTVHNNLSSLRIHSLTHSLACLDSWTWRLE